MASHTKFLLWFNLCMAILLPVLTALSQILPQIQPLLSADSAKTVGMIVVVINSAVAGLKEYQTIMSLKKENS